MKQNLVGKAFEDLREEEMEAVQGAVSTRVLLTYPSVCGTGMSLCVTLPPQQTVTFTCITLPLTPSTITTITGAE